MSKFVWLQDLEIFSYAGGAEMTDRTHFKEGLNRGHEIELLTPQRMAGGDIPDGIAIVSNATMFSPEFISEFKDCIFFLHDYANICVYRLFYPVQPKCRNCYRKESWLPVMLKAKLLIWLSPLHRKAWLWNFPELRKMPYALIPSPVNTEQFYPMYLERKGVVCVNSLLPFKDGDNPLIWAREHPNEQLTIVGENPYPELPPNCKYIGRVPYKDLNKVYNEHRAFLHLPNTPQPFNRVVAEAILAGCEIIGNKLIGALSWPFMKRDRKVIVRALKKSPKKFWEAIEGAF